LFRKSDTGGLHLVDVPERPQRLFTRCLGLRAPRYQIVDAFHDVEVEFLIDVPGDVRSKESQVAAPARLLTHVADQAG